MGKQFVFGSGSVYGTNAVANSTPERFGGLQGISLDFQFNLKELYGQLNFPLTVARAAGKITGKAMAASFQARQFNDIFFGGTLTTGETRTAQDEGPTSIPTTPFQVTAVNTATFVTDLGVTDYATGLQMVKVASAPAAGQYSVSVAGVYTFNTADNAAAKKVQLNYTYTVAAVGQKIAIAQSTMGVAPNFSLVLTSIYQSQQLNLVLNACVANKLALATKLEDFTIPDFEFQAFADSSGAIGYISMANIGD